MIRRSFPTQLSDEIFIVTLLDRRGLVSAIDLSDPQPPSKRERQDQNARMGLIMTSVTSAVCGSRSR